MGGCGSVGPGQKFLKGPGRRFAGVVREVVGRGGGMGWVVCGRCAVGGGRCAEWRVLRDSFFFFFAFFSRRRKRERNRVRSVGGRRSAVGGGAGRGVDRLVLAFCWGLFFFVCALCVFVCFFCAWQKIKKQK